MAYTYTDIYRTCLKNQTARKWKVETTKEYFARGGKITKEEKGKGNQLVNPKWNNKDLFPNK